MASRIYAWLDSRLKLAPLEKTLLDEAIPGGASWIYVFGSATLFLFVLQAVTGMFLAVYYAPTPDHAYDSVQYIEQQVSFGWFVRGLHHWGASGMVIAVGLHMLQAFLYGAFKPPREMMWMVGVVLFLLVMGFAFTGYIAGKGEAHDEEEQHHADHPHHLARRLEGAVEKRLQHVQADRDHHSRGAPVMQPANEPPERHLLFDVLD